MIFKTSDLTDFRLSFDKCYRVCDSDFQFLIL